MFYLSEPRVNGRGKNWGGWHGDMLGDHSEASNPMGKETDPAHCHPGNLGEQVNPETRRLGIIWHSWLSTVRLESDILDRIKECQAWESQKPCSPTPHLINRDTKTHKVKWLV